MNLIDNKKINEIKHAHDDFITHLRHYFDKINNRDLLLSLSEDDNNLKLWDINNIECLLNIKRVNNKGFLNSACYLYDNKRSVIITSNNDIYNKDCEFIKIFDLNGKIIKEIEDSNQSTFFIDTFYDKKMSKFYILTGNKGLSQSFDYNDNKKYFTYCEDNDEINYHMSILIDDSDKIIKMIESSCKGFIRIWDFHTANLLDKISVDDNWLYSIYLWNKEFLFVACKDCTIKVISLNESKIIKSLEGHENKVLTIKHIIHPKYGECLISQDAGCSVIKLWKISKLLL